MFIEAIGIVAVAAIGGTAAGLHVGNVVRLGAEDTEERFRSHSARADLDVVGFLDDAAAVGPVFLERKDCLLESLAAHRDSRMAVLRRLRSTCSSIMRLSRRRKSAAVSRVQVRGARAGRGVNSISSAIWRDSAVTRSSGRKPARRTDQSAKYVTAGQTFTLERR